MTTIEDSASIGRLIRAERKRQNLTQQELAGLAGVGIRFLRELESGKDSCRLGLTLLVLQTLGLRLTTIGRGDS